MSSRELKARIIEVGASQGFHDIKVASIEPMHEDLATYQAWLDKGYAADMAYLKRDPARRVHPAMSAPQARSVLMLKVPYTSTCQAPPDDRVWGRVARYAVGLDYHEIIRARLERLCEALCILPASARAATDDLALYEQALARRHGAGFIGKNSLLIGPKMSGSYHFIAELFVDLELEPDTEYVGTCGSCFRCGTACPTDAIVDSGTVDSNLCISYLTIENKYGIDPALRARLGDWAFGCDICQEVCPYNSQIARLDATSAEQRVWPELRPEAGVGHYLDLLGLIALPDDESYRRMVGKSPLRRPKRRGLTRNGLVVLGNWLGGRAASEADRSRWHEEIVEAIGTYIMQDRESMLLEHALWALAQARERGDDRASDLIAGFDRARLEPDDRDRADSYFRIDR